MTEDPGAIFGAFLAQQFAGESASPALITSLTEAAASVVTTTEESVEIPSLSHPAKPSLYAQMSDELNHTTAVGYAEFQRNRDI